LKAGVCRALPWLGQVSADPEKNAFLVYLNEACEGGETRFYREGRPCLEVHPACGQALVFVHEQLHEGAAVMSGRKYVLRTDVMYRRTSASPSQRGINPTLRQ
jgi:hypothetical protein